MKKLFLSLCILFMTISVFAADWYVCMGSFKDIEKAQDRETVLNQSGFSTFISEYQKDENTKLFRILYSEKFENKEAAKFRKNELLNLSKITELELTDIWYCESDGIRYTIPEEENSFPEESELPEETVFPEEVELQEESNLPAENLPEQISLDEEEELPEETNLPDNEPEPDYETEVQEQANIEPVKQTVIVKINNIEEQRFDISSDDRVIRINVNVPELENLSQPEAELNMEESEDEE